MIETNRRSSFLRPLLVTALPLVLLEAGTTSVYAQTTYTDVSSANQLSADITAIDLASQAGTGSSGAQYFITLAGAAWSGLESADIAAINLKGADTLTINGEGDALDGNGHRGLFVYSGQVMIENLTIENAVAKGGAGAAGGGGGAGLGGGLFVANNSSQGAAPAKVTLSNVTFTNDSAAGGGGGFDGVGGGGGMGGAGGWGGGGVGSTGYGGSGWRSAGGAGLIPGAAAGGAGGIGGAGGASGGGGGAGGDLADFQKNQFYYGGGGGGGVGGGAGGVREFVIGPGGAGGFGGGGGRGFSHGGTGGFGGGGGGGHAIAAGGGGNGGFGGGGGGVQGPGSPVGGGGFGGGGGGFGGAGDPGAGGGGLGAGGDIFVMAGASLTIEGGNLGAGTVAGGAAGGTGAGAGSAYGGAMFLQGNETITLVPASGTTETISGVIADQTGSGGTGANAGAGGLVLNGAGTLDLAAVNTFTGGITIDKGALELANSAAAGSGKIAFATGAGATLKVNNGVFAVNPIASFTKGDTVEFLGNGSEALASPSSGGAIDMSSSGGDEAGLLSGNTLGATISGFGSRDKVDFDAVGYASTDRVAYASGIVSIDNSTGATVASFDVTGTYTAANFKLSADPSDGSLVVSYVATPIAAALDFAAAPAIAGIPEPSTWAMTALGFAGLAFAGYRGSRKGAAFAA